MMKTFNSLALWLDQTVKKLAANSVGKIGKKCGRPHYKTRPHFCVGLLFIGPQSGVGYLSDISFVGLPNRMIPE
jgi:hypothetical protein